MKIPHAPVFAAILLTASFILAADEAELAALQIADDTRIAAVKAVDRAALEEILSEDLHYRHSSGTADTKASFIEWLASGRAKYTVYDIQERNFTFASPEIALMNGRAHVKVETATGGMDSMISLLAVWRKENGKWRFLAWQSCRMPPKNP